MQLRAALLLLHLCGVVLPAGAQGASAEAPLDFHFSGHAVRHEMVGAAASVGRGLTVAYNGTHTRIMDTKGFPNSVAEDVGYWAWSIVAPDPDYNNSDPGDPAPAYPQDRTGHVVASLGNGALLMFGGVDTVEGNTLDDTWVFNVSTSDSTRGAWTQRASADQPAPEARHGHAMATLDTGHVLLYGGVGYVYPNPPQMLDDVWVFDVVTKWTQINTTSDGPPPPLPANASAPPSSPGARTGHALAPLGFPGGTTGTGKALLFGGVTAAGGLAQDSWLFALAPGPGTANRGSWEQVVCPAAPRTGHAMALTNTSSFEGINGEQVVMFGGLNSSAADDPFAVALDDTWVYDVQSEDWKKTARRPSARYGHTLVTVGDEHTVVLMHGGSQSPPSDDDGIPPVPALDAWTYEASINGPDDEFYKWNPTVNAPEARALHAMATLDGGRALMFGGWRFNGDDYQSLNDAWVYQLLDPDGTGFDDLKGKWLRAKNGPINVHSHAMATIDYQTVLMHGGINDDGPQGATYTFVCASHDTYACDVGSGVWSLAENSTGHGLPGPRWDHAMAMLGHGRVLLYGGKNGTDGDALADTWIYDARARNDGTTPPSTGRWERNDEAGTPPARHSHAMATLQESDEYGANGRAILFGGMDASGDDALSDVWAYQDPVYGVNSSGTPFGWGSWVSLGEADGPVARYGHAMASLGGGRVALYGGKTDSGTDGPLGDVYLLHHVQISEFDYSYHFEPLASSSRAAQGMAARYGHAMAPVTMGALSGAVHRVVFFGGDVGRPSYGTSETDPEPEPADDTWTLLAGCPVGTMTPGCDPCPPGTYNDMVMEDGDGDICQACPAGTTTETSGAVHLLACSFCVGHTPQDFKSMLANGSGLRSTCFVDLNASAPVLECLPGRWGAECEQDCPKGTLTVSNGHQIKIARESGHPCSNQGTCSDGVEGTGKCMCAPHYYGDACESYCGVDVDANGDCTCGFWHAMSGQECSFPTVAFLLAIVLTGALSAFAVVRLRRGGGGGGGGGGSLFGGSSSGGGYFGINDGDSRRVSAQEPLIFLSDPEAPEDGATSGEHNRSSSLEMSYEPPLSAAAGGNYGGEEETGGGGDRTDAADQSSPRGNHKHPDDSLL